MTDVFRKEYRLLSDSQKHAIVLIKDKASELLNLFEDSSANQNIDNRAMALAKTNLEQAIMWAVKAIT